MSRKRILNVSTRLVQELVITDNGRFLERILSSCAFLKCPYPTTQCSNCRFCDLDKKSI